MSSSGRKTSPPEVRWHGDRRRERGGFRGGEVALDPGNECGVVDGLDDDIEGTQLEGQVEFGLVPLGGAEDDADAGCPPLP